MKKTRPNQVTSPPNVKRGTNPSRAAAPKSAPHATQPGAPSTKSPKFNNNPLK